MKIENCIIFLANIISDYFYKVLNTIFVLEVTSTMMNALSCPAVDCQ